MPNADAFGHQFASNNFQESPRFSEEHWMSQADSRVHDVLMKPEPIGWEPSRTAPLDYPTPSVRRGVTRFHEQVTPLKSSLSRSSSRKNTLFGPPSL